MKAILVLTAAALMATTQAKADGFVCTTETGMNVKVFNHTQPELGTRTGAIMVVSDSSVNSGRKTIATFKDLTGTLTSKELVYTSKVDLRFNDSGRKGEWIGGTKLGELSSVVLKLNFSYAAPKEESEYVSGKLILNKRNGEVLREAVDCARYLKN